MRRIKWVGRDHSAGIDAAVLNVTDEQRRGRGSEDGSLSNPPLHFRQQSMLKLELLWCVLLHEFYLGERRPWLGGEAKAGKVWFALCLSERYKARPHLPECVPEPGIGSRRGIDRVHLEATRQEQGSPAGTDKSRPE
jgi:hypothetical protein